MRAELRRRCTSLLRKMREKKTRGVRSGTLNSKFRKCCFFNQKCYINFGILLSISTTFIGVLDTTCTATCAGFELFSFLLLLFARQDIKGNRKIPSKLGRKILWKKARKYKKRYLLETRNPFKESCAARSTVAPACLCGESLACHSAGNNIEVTKLKPNKESVAHIGRVAYSQGQKACCRGLPGNWERPTYQPTGKGVGHTYLRGRRVVHTYLITNTSTNIELKRWAPGELNR